MASQTKAKPEPKPNEPFYVGWRGDLIARLALARAGFDVKDAPVPEPFDLLAATPDGFYFLVKVNAYSSMHGGRGPTFNRPRDEYRWPVGPAVLRAAGDVNLPAVLFVIDADREVGHYARLDRLPRPDHGQRTTSVSLAAGRNLSREAIATLVSKLRQDWAASRRPA